jgi:hypothetical protein
LFCAGVLSALNGIAAEQETAKDLDADREFALAAWQVAQVDSVVEGELKRVMLRQSGPPSPDLQKYIYTKNVPSIDIGDVHIALHLRLIERERREGVEIIAVARSLAAITCDNSSLPLNPDKFLDADSQQRALSNLQCNRDKLNRAQAAHLKLLKMHEASALELNLPRYTENQELTRARERTVQQDAEVERGYASERKNIQVTENLLLLLKAHAANIHFKDGRLVFDDPAVGKTAQDLMRQMAE